MSLSGILNMAQWSISNNQTALNVVSNNIANMNTTNYSKQNVIFSNLPGYDTYNWCSSNGTLNIGQGAYIGDITRNRQQWLDNNLRNQYSSFGYYNQIVGMANNVENMLNGELSSDGLEKKLSDFFAASQALSGDPTNQAYKIAFINAAKDVSDLLNNMSSTLNGYMEQAIGKFGDPDSFANSQINTSVNELNEKLDQLAEINGKIAQTPNSNALLDQRDALLDEISQYVPIKTTTNSNNTINVIIGGQTVVKGGEKKLDIQAVQTDNPDDPVNIQLVDQEGNIKKADIKDSIKDSKLTAIIQVGKGESFGYKSVMNDLDKIAQAFAEEMNKIQTQQTPDGKTPMYIGPDGTLVESTTPIFVTKDGTGNFTAGNISINEDILNDPSLIATARVDVNSPDFDENAVGNTGNMDLFNNLVSQKIPGLSSTTPAGEGMTLNDYLSSLVAKVGGNVSTIKTEASTQQSVTQQAKAQRDAISGVNLNQELSDLIKYQRSYEASARIFNVANELMQIITQLGA